VKANREKKTATFASIFGEDYDPNEVTEKDNGSVKLKLEELVPFKNHLFKLYC